MECRPLDIRLLSANDIKNVNRFTKMDVYALVVVSGDPRTRQRSPTDKQGGTSPKWNYSLRFTLDHAALQSGLLTLIFRLRSERLLGDKDIGHVQIPLIQLLDTSAAADNKDHRLVSYQLTTKSGQPKGTLNFSYAFGDKFQMPIKPQLPIIDPPAYPPVAAPRYGAYAEGASSSSVPPAAAYPYAPPPYGAPAPGAYPYPAPGPYAGYPPQAAGGYGYRPQTPQKSGGSNFGLGLGAGLLGVGGLLVATDIAEDMAYDAGYDDAMGGMDSMDF